MDYERKPVARTGLLSLNAVLFIQLKTRVARTREISSPSRLGDYYRSGLARIGPDIPANCWFGGETVKTFG